MRYLTIILSLTFLLADKLEVDGDLKVTGNIEAGQIESLQQTILTQQTQIEALQTQIISLQAQITFLQQQLGLIDCEGVIGGDTIVDDCGVCNGDNSACTALDIDGNLYYSVEIGNQTWLSDNLRTTHYKNGDPIEFISTPGTSPNYAAYFTSPSPGVSVFGYLYNWYAVDDSRGICPEGWHVPSQNEFNDLKSYLGDSAGGKLKETGIYYPTVPELSTGYWYEPNIGATNETGFSGRAAGSRHCCNGQFTNNQYSQGTFWTTDEGQPNSNGDIYTPAFRLLHNYDTLQEFTEPPPAGLSVRCIKD